MRFRILGVIGMTKKGVFASRLFKHCNVVSSPKLLLGNEWP